MSEGHFIETFTVPETFKYKTLRDRDVLEWNGSCQEAFQWIDDKQTPNSRTVACLAQLTGNADWLHPDTSRLAEELLCSFDINVELVQSVLEFHVKPLFVANPHPQLNISTGRSLHRIAGGPMASQDYYDEQTWKNYPGLSNLISWCISQIPTQDFEQVWHFLIPAVMTFLDDYQSPYKLHGVMLVSNLLESVSPNLLKRTGIAQLLIGSLSRTLMSLHDELSPRLIKTTVPVILRLIEMTTPPDSAERFDKLCSLLGDSIIGAVWIYASREQETIEASMDVLPLIIQVLGIGIVRYLKALIPQCLHSITINELVPRSKPLEQAALRALLSVIQECQPRMYRWKGTIIEGVGKYWISTCEHKEKSEEDDTMRCLVQEIFASLSKACPSVLQEEYPRLLQVEPNLLRSIIMTA